METKTRWEQMVTEKFTTNFITPANFCNGEDHRFVVMAFGGDCEERGPPSSEVIAKCGKWPLLVYTILYTFLFFYG